MNLEIICIIVLKLCGEETLYLVRVQRGTAVAEIRITEETANILHLILGVPFCE